MKRYKLFIAFGAALVFFSLSCKKSFLDKTPQTQISSSDFWKSSNDVNLYVNNLYNNYLPTYSGYFSFGIYGLDAEYGSDNMITTYYGYRGNILNGERSVSSSIAGGEPFVQWDWSDIRNVNYFLANYSKVSEPFQNIKSYVGEALFFKAYLYFNKLKTYGDLPWINKVLSPDDPELYNGRLSRGIVVDSMLNILDQAISYLPASNPMRVNKGTAQALQSRIALYEGTWEKYHAGDPFGVAGSDGSKYLQKAAQVSSDIMKGGGYSLDNMGTSWGYWNLFNQTDYSGSKEIMFWRKYDPSQQLYTLWSVYSRGGSGRGITKSLVDSYLCKDGQPISKSPLYTGDDSLNLVVINRDPRLTQTIQVDDKSHYWVIGTQPHYFLYPSFNAASNEDKCPTGYQLYKGHNTDTLQQQYGHGSDGLIYFRYAEVLLNYAEAKASLGTITQADLDESINLLRSRVNMPHLVLSGIVTDPKWDFPELSPILNEVRRERRVELAAEGFRHDDIWRWAAADKLIVSKKPLGAPKAQWVSSSPNSQYAVLQPSLSVIPVNAGGYIDWYQAALPNGYQFKLNRDYLIPIPIDQITLSRNQIKQNPNW